MGEIRCPYLSLWPSVRCRSRPRTRPVARCTHYLTVACMYLCMQPPDRARRSQQTRGPEDRYLSFFLGNQSAVENFTTSPRRGKVRSEPPQSAPVSGRKSLPTAPSSLGLEYPNARPAFLLHQTRTKQSPPPFLRLPSFLSLLYCSETPACSSSSSSFRPHMQLRDTAAKQAEAAATAEAVVAVARRWSIFAKLPAMCCSVRAAAAEARETREPRRRRRRQEHRNFRRVDPSFFFFFLRFFLPSFPDLFFPHHHRASP